MPNVLDTEPVRAFARRAAAKIADERIAARFERLAIARLMQDVRNFAAATEAHLHGAPDWAHQARDRGEVISVFKLHRGAAQSLHNLARRLDATRQLAALDLAQSPNRAVYVSAAREFIDKLERADFATTRSKASFFARLHVLCSDTSDSERVCPEQTLLSTSGRRWLRVTSVSELQAVGREFRNCLARTSRNSLYGGGLYRGERQFWVLRDAEGAGRVVAMADAPKATALMEVRGPRNGRISSVDQDLMRLSRALGLRPPPPPPSPPPVMARLQLRDLPCRCLLCSPSAPALRLAAAAT